ncbi:MAG: divalent metal cation transporter [Phycisphaerales bacterium JB063]
MTDTKLQQDRELLAAAESKGLGAKLAAYTKLSGPGWLQSAITLGGGSLAGSLYIGVIGGYKMLWLQPVMMILGIVMLSAIAYVTLSTGEKPFRSINKHVNPVLGWGWLAAAMIANLVWAMPQFSLGTAAMQQNLGLPLNNWGCSAILFVIACVVIWFYDAGGWGIKLFEILLKVMVGLIVLAFFGVVIALSLKGALPWAEVFAGYVPDFSLLSKPAAGLRPFIEASSDPVYWSDKIVGIQRDTMITAAATAVGINMTFLLPYSMLRKGWDKTFRGLATFDLSTGLFIPFVLATSCVVIAAATQFHGTYDKGLVGEAEPTQMTKTLQKGYDGNLEAFLATPRVRGTGSDKPLTIDKRWESERNPDTVNAADRQLAAMTIKSDSGALAISLENVTGSKAVAQYVFGLGVAGMALSTLIILMLINGFTFTEALGAPTSGVMHRVGSFLPAVTGGLGFLLIWGPIPESRFWLAVPTSRIGMMLLPVAYITFFLMMNSRKLMGDNLMVGGKRIAANVVMVIAIAVATYGCALSLWMSTQEIPGTQQSVRPFLMALVIGFIAAVVVVQLVRKKPDDALL